MNGCGALAALLVGAMVVLVTWDVAMRNLGGPNLPWIVEVTEYALPLATFLAAPWLLYRYEHVRLDLLAVKLSPERLRVIERVAAALCLAVSLTIVWYSIRVIADTRGIGALVMKSLVFPEWWVFVPVPVCFGLLALESGRRLVFPPPPSPPTATGGHGGA
ncbi:MAG TPA: TRAP transporter small permease [Burkholderiaceae bacterium]|nr:TRAP transporter small permease [Burkholderiaceae bacterium]